MSIKVKVWDVPVRLSHWLLVAGIAAAIATGEVGGALIDWHGRIGVFILGVVVFRLVWGLVGSTYARFTHFFPTPRSLRAYLRGEWRGLGHNPIGGLAVFALLGVTLAMVGSGLVANDDIGFQGPLAGLVSKEASDALTGWHGRILYILAGLTALHVSAMAFYARVKKVNLIGPMVTGTKVVDGAGPVEHTPIGPVRIALALAIAALIAWAVGSDAVAARWTSSSVAASTGAPSW